MSICKEATEFLSAHRLSKNVSTYYYEWTKKKKKSSDSVSAWECVYCYTDTDAAKLQHEHTKT